MCRSGELLFTFFASIHTFSTSARFAGNVVTSFEPSRELPSCAIGMSNRLTRGSRIERKARTEATPIFLCIQPQIHPRAIYDSDNSQPNRFRCCPRIVSRCARGGHVGPSAFHPPMSVGRPLIVPEPDGTVRTRFITRTCQRAAHAPATREHPIYRAIKPSIKSLRFVLDIPDRSEYSNFTRSNVCARPNLAEKLKPIGQQKGNS